MTIQSPDYFKLDGVSSEKYGLYVDTPPMPPLAQRNSTSINYIANHENFVYLQDYYNNISITLNCYFFEPPENISALYSWLATGKKLETSRFHDFYYKIKSLKGITPKYRGFGNYALNITFECSPYRYKDNNLKFDCDDAFLQNGLSVMNYGSIPSFPLITIAVTDADCIKMIDGNSLQNATEEKANVLYVNQQKFGFFVVVESGETALGPIGYYCIDCYNKVAYRRENGETLLTIGKYPEFKAGNNYIETKGTKIGNFWKLENEERYI